ncbi:MAG: hypothetical protein ABW321_27285 [Polyangiales bacterium]
MSESVVTTRSMAFDVLHDVVLVVHADCPPDDGDWDAFLDRVRGLGLAQRYTSLVLCEGPGPNAGQRKRMMALPGLSDARTVVLTTSLVARGTVTALNWLGYRKLRALDYADLTGGLDYLRVPRAHHLDIAARVVALKHGLLGVPPSDAMSTDQTLTLAVLTLAQLTHALPPRGDTSAA